jgi:hypothetical protein
MASHFTMIGLPVESAEDMDALAKRIGPVAEPLAAPNGTYLQWKDPSGAELWLQTDAKNEIIGMTPFYAGRSSVRVGLTARTYVGQPSELDGCFHGWADPQCDAPDSGCYLFIFDAPDYWLHDQLELPVQREVQIAAFAHQISAFETERAFEASRKEGQGYSSQLFIPTGLFTPDNGAVQPQAQAFFSGYVLDAGEKINALTDRAFYWALVDTIGGTFDVVIDKTLLPAAPATGGVVSGSFWLSGRIVG